VSFNCVCAAYAVADCLQEAHALLNAVTVTPTAATHKLLMGAALAQGKPGMVLHAWRSMTQALLAPDMETFEMFLDALAATVRRCAMLLHGSPSVACAVDVCLLQAVHLLGIR
jgi:hypothetical protein